MPGLMLAWHTTNWRVYQLGPGTGIVTGPAALTSMQGDGASLDVFRAGAILVRIRWSADWTVTSGEASLAEAPGGWITVLATHPGVVRLNISV